MPLIWGMAEHLLAQELVVFLVYKRCYVGASLSEEVIPYPTDPDSWSRGPRLPSERPHQVFGPNQSKAVNASLFTPCPLQHLLQLLWVVLTSGAQGAAPQPFLSCDAFLSWCLTNSGIIYNFIFPQPFWFPSVQCNSHIIAAYHITPVLS